MDRRLRLDFTLVNYFRFGVYKVVAADQLWGWPDPACGHELMNPLAGLAEAVCKLLDGYHAIPYKGCSDICQ